MKKLFSVLIVAVMLLGMVPFAFAADTAPAAITLNEAVTVNADRNNPEAVFTYTVADDGDYVFYADGENTDTVGTILDANGEIITKNDDYNENNFVCIASLKKGDNITLCSRLYNVSRKATYTVTLVKRSAATAIVAEDVEIYEGYSFFLEYSLEPVGSFNEDVSVTIADPTVVTSAEDGNIYYAAKAGTTTLTLSSENGLTKTVNVTVKKPTQLTFNEKLTDVSEKIYMGAKYSFTPETSGYYTFEVNSNRYLNAYVSTDAAYYAGADGINVAVPVYMEAGKTYTLSVNTYSLNQSYTVVVRNPKPVTDIYITGADEIQYVGFQDWLYAYGEDGEIAGDVEWSVDDPTVASIQKDSSYSATIIINKPGIVTVTAKYGDAEESTIVMGAAIPTIKAGTPYTEETIGMNDAIVNFTPEKSGVYRVRATDELGVDTMVDISEYNRKENFCDYYMQAGSTYMIRASRFFMGIGYGYDEYDYVGDITIEINELGTATGLKFNCGDTLTAYKDIDFDVTAVPTNDNAAFEDYVLWSVSDTEKGEILWRDGESAKIVFYETGDYTITASTVNGFTETLNVKIVEPESMVLDKEYQFTVPAHSAYSLAFTAENTAYYTAALKSDVDVFGMFGDYSFGGTDEKVSTTIVANQTNPVTITNKNDTPATVTLVVRKTRFSTSMKTSVPAITLAVGENYYTDFIFNLDEVWENIESTTSSNEKVVQADENGQLFAIGEGTATVTFVSEYGLKATMTVTVVGNNYDWAYDISLNKDELELKAGASETLTATVEADGEKTVYWTSEDESIARVDANGRVTGVSEGVTKIIAVVDDAVAYCEVTVKNPEIVDTSKVFTDVKAGKWYANAIDYAYSYGFIAGVSKTEFGLNTAVTRGMFITILARIAGVDTTTKGINNVKTKFTDVKSGKYYTAAIKWANDNGIVSGTSDTTFGPDNQISRQDLCVMVVNFAKFMNVELTASKDEIAFADASSISKYAKSAVKTCQMAEIVSGYNVTGGVEFRPKNTATRAEAAQILYKFHLDFIA